MAPELSASARTVQEELNRLGVDSKVTDMGQTTRSALDAAKAVGCAVGQIAKSLVFKCSASRQAVLVITSGANRVNENSLAEVLSEPVQKADADFVRRKTGYAIGGVPPVGLHEPLRVFIDEDLFQYAVIWAAAGTPQAVFKLTPQELQRVTGGRVLRVK